MFHHFSSNWKLKGIVIFVPLSFGSCLMVVSMTIVGSSSYYGVINVTLFLTLYNFPLKNELFNIMFVIIVAHAI